MKIAECGFCVDSVKWDFLRFADKLESGHIDFTNSSSKEEEFGKQPLTPMPLVKSNAITSKINGTDLHKVAIDLDMDATLVPSSTPGHHHLIIDKALPWSEYRPLLEALATAGIIEKGYCKASVNRGATVLRTPWTKK